MANGSIFGSYPVGRGEASLGVPASGGATGLALPNGMPRAREGQVVGRLASVGVGAYSFGFVTETGPAVDGTFAGVAT